MKYLEVKLEQVDKKDISSDSFVSDVIENQSNLGVKTRGSSFNKEELLTLGFLHNSTTGGFYICRDMDFKELDYLTRIISKLENHILTHSFIILKIHNNELYFWDTSLIYEGVDSFEYCLEHHNLFTLGSINVLTNSDSVNEELLNLANYTKRYHEPALGFITQNCVWDKKEGMKILKSMVSNINEYMSLDEVINY